MNHLLPHDPETLALVVASYALTLVLSFGITRLRSRSVGRVAGWFLFLLAIAWTVWLVRAEPPFLQLCALVVPVPAMKALVSVEYQALGEAPLKPLNWFAFTAGWFGMRPSVFATLGNPRLPGVGNVLWFGVSRIALGLLFFWVGRGVWLLTTPWLGTVGAAYLATLLLLPGLSLIIHFGLPNVVGAAWRLAGVDCRIQSLFRTPMHAHSLGEFWGRRWNLAFMETTTLLIYRPLVKIVGSRVATMAAFLWSGLVHELAFAVPVKSGYGLWTLYFALQCALVFLERGLEQMGWSIARTGWFGRLWTVSWFVFPLLVFIPREFYEQVCWPMVLGMEQPGSHGS